MMMEMMVIRMRGDGDGRDGSEDDREDKEDEEEEEVHDDDGKSDKWIVQTSTQSPHNDGVGHMLWRIYLNYPTRWGGFTSYPRATRRLTFFYMLIFSTEKFV